ncbi:MAG TPA: response regulator transcription factor [Chitinophagaceae bacterium]|jgi:two-component system invasion response regulator UvrY|nr:response regulator transcription factor [Chitinophagaceae bacterium]HPH33442.1 response regulator transcription factor [Chitinophagaceae bacterium]
MKRIKVYLVDDHRMMLDMWNSLLSIDNRFSVVGISTDGRLALEEIKEKLPNVVLMDISMPGISGIELTRTIKEKFPLTQVLAVSMHTNVLTIKQILSAGASGYMSKTSSFEEMVQALIEVYNGKHYIADDIKNLIAEQLLGEPANNPVNRINSLTKRELEIISMIREGLSSHDIALKLFISQRTVEVHRYNIFKKLNVSNVVSMMKVLNQEAV